MPKACLMSQNTRTQPARVGGTTESEKKRPRDKHEINWDNTRGRLEKTGETRSERWKE